MIIPRNFVKDWQNSEKYGVKQLVRIWRLPVEILDRQHLLGEHAELHLIVNTILKKHRGEKGAWQNHPEVLRFENHMCWLEHRHKQQVKEMEKRGYKHNSPLPVARWVLIQKERNYTYTNKEMAEDWKILKERQGEIPCLLPHLLRD